MQKIFSLTSSFITLFFLLVANVSCNENNAKSYSASVGAAAAPKPLNTTDLQFLYDAYNLSLYNIQLANEAIIRSTATETNALAESILSSSSKLKSAIDNIAEKYNVELPADITNEQKNFWKELVKQKGWEFDKNFAIIAEENFTKGNKLYTTANETCNYKELKDIAASALIDLKTQTTLAEADQEKIKQRTEIPGEEDEELTKEKEIIKAKPKH